MKTLLELVAMGSLMFVGLFTLMMIGSATLSYTVQKMNKFKRRFLHGNS